MPVYRHDISRFMCHHSWDHQQCPFHLTMTETILWSLLLLATIVSPINSFLTLVPVKSIQNRGARLLLRLHSSSMPCWFDAFADSFSGDFDNYDQVVADRMAGLEPREGGGHENIHCTLVPLSPTERLAAFYFDGNPKRIFRFRYYRLVVVQPLCVNMMLYTIRNDVEMKLRQEADPLKWVDIWNTTSDDGNENAIKTSLLPNCDVQWSTCPDPIQHAYYSQHQSEEGATAFHAIMIHGEALVESQMMPGVEILVRDQLSLTENELWIHDRGYNPKTMEFIYGNQKLIPYRLKRVSQIAYGSNRVVTNEELKWTLGPGYRTENEYQEKLLAVGGVSSQMNQQK